MVLWYSMIKRLCVFCGINAPQRYVQLGEDFGKKMAEASLELVYGGASIGLMGIIANAVLRNKGKVYGVIPKKLVKMEVAHEGLTELLIVESLHDRKAKMYDLSDVFVALPGGLGTLDELCEILTWAKLKYHHKPIFILNHENFFDSLMTHFRHINKEGFLNDVDFSLVREVTSMEQLFLEISILDDFPLKKAE